MNDINGINQSFTEWSSVMNFLSELIPERDKVKDIHIAGNDRMGWTMKIEETGKSKNQQIKKTAGAGLYDLYW